MARLPLRQLIALARERFGAQASKLKTREELLGALTAPVAEVVSAPTLPPALAPAEPEPAREEVVTRDFFRRR